MLSYIFSTYAIITFLPLFILAFHQKLGWYILLLMSLASTAINVRFIGSPQDDPIALSIALGFVFVSGMGIYQWSAVRRLSSLNSLPSTIATPPPPSLQKSIFQPIKKWGWLLSFSVLVVGIVGTLQYNDDAASAQELTKAYWIIATISSLIGFALLALRHATGWLLFWVCAVFILISMVSNALQESSNAPYYPVIILVVGVYCAPIIIGMVLWNTRYKQQQQILSRYQ